jgi:phage-related protein
MVIKFWVNKSDKCPVKDFISKQHVLAGQRIMKDIDHLKQQGLSLAINPGKMKPLQGHKKMYELKTSWKGIYYRIIFSVENGEAWMLEAFKKKGNATPQRYINTALQRRCSIAGSPTKQERG